MPPQVAPRAHAFRKVEPEFGVGNGILPESARSSFLVAHVGQHGPPQLAFIQAKGEPSQVARERFHMMIVVARILAQILARQLTRRPRPVERMAQQVVARNRCFQLLKKRSAIHRRLPGLRP